MADEVTPAPSWISKWWPSLVVAAVTAAAWFVLAPWDWSTVDAAGHERTGATGDAWAALIGVALVSGMAVATVVRRRPDAVLRAPLAGLATFIVLYAWRASQARVKGGNLWPLGLIGVVLPIGLLGTFGGSWLALRTIRARNRERGSAATAPSPDPPPGLRPRSGARSRLVRAGDQVGWGTMRRYGFGASHVP